MVQVILSPLQTVISLGTNTSWPASEPIFTEAAPIAAAANAVAFASASLLAQYEDPDTFTIKSSLRFSMLAIVTRAPRIVAGSPVMVRVPARVAGTLQSAPC